jgi:sirohydrochlorin ferrochelatase
MRHPPLTGRAAAPPTGAVQQALTGRAAAPPTGAVQQALTGRAAAPPERAVQQAPAGWPPLVAVAHGSSDPRAAATITELAGVVAARAHAAGLPHLQTRVAYLSHALPSVPRVLESLAGERGVVVLPLLLTPAYHSDTDLPAVLSEAGRRLPGLRIRYGQPLGPHPWLLRALDRRVAEAIAGTGSLRITDTAVVLAAAGSGRPEANAAVAAVAAAWQLSRGWRAVVPAYVSAGTPTPGQAVAELRDSGAAKIIVASYLLAPGYFADKIREQSLAAGALAVSAPLGAAAEVARVALARYLRAARPDGLGPDSGIRA